jgi:hypothetical protein
MAELSSAALASGADPDRWLYQRSQILSLSIIHLFVCLFILVLQIVIDVMYLCMYVCM